MPSEEFIEIVLINIEENCQEDNNYARVKPIKSPILKIAKGNL